MIHLGVASKTHPFLLSFANMENVKINPKKTFIGSLVAFFLGISCCWMSALAIWLGGATVLTSFAHYFGKLQYAILLIGVLLGGLSLFLYFKRRQTAQNQEV